MEFNKDAFAAKLRGRMAELDMTRGGRGSYRAFRRMQ